MPLSRRALKGWEKLSPSVSHPPLSWSLSVVLAVKMASQARSVFSAMSLSIGLLVAWEAYLRVGELCALTLGDVSFNSLNDPVKLGRKKSGAGPASALSRSPVLVSFHLAHTKTGDHQWAHIRSISCCCSSLVLLPDGSEGGGLVVWLLPPVRLLSCCFP